MTIFVIRRFTAITRAACVATCCLTWLANAGAAQDDPFADPTSDTSAASDSSPTGDSDLFSPSAPNNRSTVNAESAAAQPASNSYLKTDPLIRRVRQNPPKTTAEMSRAVTWMTQLRSWEDVGQLLQQIGQENWSLSQQSELARSIDPSIWSLLLRSSGKLTDEQGKLLKNLYAAPAKHAREPQVIRALINQLATGQFAVAQLRLQDGGELALKQIVDSLIAGNTQVPAGRLAQAALLFERDGIQALQAACSLGDNQQSARVLLALAELPSSGFASELTSNLYSVRHSAQFKSSLAEKLQGRLGRLPTQTATLNHLNEACQEALAEYQAQRLAHNPISVTFWQANQAGSVSPVKGSKTQAALERLTQLNCLRAEQESVPLMAKIGATVFQLQRAYQLNPVLNDPDLNSQWMRLTLLDEIDSADLWMQIFDQATTWQMHGAAVRSLQMLKQHAQAGKFAIPLDQVSRLLTDQRPVIRYMAMELIVAADPTQDYAGSTQVLAVALEMTNLTQGPQALIIGGNIELCMAADQIIQQFTQTASVPVSSGRAALLALAKPNPIELILVVDRVHDLNLYELLQRLRNSTSLPISVMVEGLSQSEQDLISKSAGIQVAVLSRDPEHFQMVLDDLMRPLDLRPMTGPDRTELSAIAGSFLTKIAADRKTYAFYPLTDWSGELQNAQGVIGIEAQSQLQAGLGTKESQARIINLVAAPGATEQSRLTAARAFEKSVRQFGLLLHDAEIKDSYELYNRLGPNDPSLAKMMGFVLDIIEAQTGTSTWPITP